MTVAVAQRTPSIRKRAFEEVRDAIAQPSDRVVLVVLFASVFWLRCGLPLFNSSPRQALLQPDSFFSGAELIGFTAIAFVLRHLGTARILRWWDLVAISIAAIALIHPWYIISTLVLTGLGLLFFKRRDRSLASLGQLCIGLAWVDLWGHCAFSLVEHWVLPIETALAYLPLSFFGSFSLVGNAILAQNGHDIEVYARCSAFHNTVITAFFWLSLIKIQKLEFNLWRCKVLAMSLTAVIMINTARICLMAYSYNGYIFWHTGFGATISQSATLALVFGLFYFGLDRKHNQAQ